MVLAGILERLKYNYVPKVLLAIQLFNECSRYGYEIINLLVS